MSCRHASPTSRYDPAGQCCCRQTSFGVACPNDLTIFVVYDVQGQNEVLHAHLQSLMSKSAQIQAAAGEVSEGYTPSGEEKTIEELRQLVGYLKKEREIVECKHELAHQEATRCVHRFFAL